MRRHICDRAGLWNSAGRSRSSRTRQPARRLRRRARITTCSIGPAGSSVSSRSPRSDRSPCRGSARRCCAVTKRSGCLAPSSRACRSRGATRRATTIWAAITWCGRAISSRRRRPARRRRARRRPARARLPAGDAERRRILAAEHVGGRRTVLARHSARRDGVSDPAARSDPTEHGADQDSHRRLLAHGPAGGRVHRPQRPGHRAGSLGRGRGAVAVHGRRRRSRRCWWRPTSPTASASRPSGTICARPPTPGTTASTRASTCKAPSWPARGRRGVLRADCAARNRRRRLSGGRVRADQESAVAAGRRGRHRDRQPRCAGAGAVRAARARRPQDSQHRRTSSTRC